MQGPGLLMPLSNISPNLQEAHSPSRKRTLDEFGQMENIKPLGLGGKLPDLRDTNNSMPPQPTSPSFLSICCFLLTDNNRRERVDFDAENPRTVSRRKQSSFAHSLRKQPTRSQIRISKSHSHTQPQPDFSCRTSSSPSTRTRHHGAQSLIPFYTIYT